MQANQPIVRTNGVPMPGYEKTVASHQVEVTPGMVAEAFGRPRHDLYGSLGKAGESLLSIMLKADELPRDTRASNQGVNLGLKAHPFNMREVVKLQRYNEYHSTCLAAKVNAMVGLGWRLAAEEEREYFEKVQEAQLRGAPAPPRPLSKVDKVLNPLCDSTWRETLMSVACDLASLENGYLEVVRRGSRDDPSAPITGIHHAPAADMYVFIENYFYERNFVARSSEGYGFDRIFAEFGDLGGFRKRMEAANAGDIDRGGGVAFQSIALPNGRSFDGNSFVSEIIHFKMPTNQSRYYGVPSWLSAVAAIDVARLERQYIADFYNNRGVPEFMLFLIGKKIESKVWDAIVASLHANIGSGNSHKSLAVNIDDPEIKVQLEKLAVEGSGSDNQSKDSRYEQLGTSIATSHGVPPLLAGILIPGKLGASNEFPNALQAFQLLRMQPFQEVIEQRLACTLGNTNANGGLALTEDDFHLTRVTDVINIAQADTVSRMRQPLEEAQAEGRDINEGLKD